MTTASLITNQGIAALKAGKRTEARKWLELAVKRNPNDYTAWLWLSGAVDGEQKRLECLQEVLRIVPNNNAAAAGVARIKARKEAIEMPAVEEYPKVPPFVDLDAVQGMLTNPAARRELPVQPDMLPSPETPERVIFHIRPSILPTTLKACLYVLGLGAVAWAILTFAAESEILMLALAIVSVFSIGVVFLVFLRALLFGMFERYKLTTRALSIQTGIIKMNLITIPVKHIRKVMRKKNLFSRIFRVGDIHIDLKSSSPHQGNIRLRSVISCPQRLRQILRVTKPR